MRTEMMTLSIPVWKLNKAGIDPRQLGYKPVWVAHDDGTVDVMWTTADRITVSLARTRLLVGHRPYVALLSDEVWFDVKPQHPGKLLGSYSMIPQGHGWGVYLDRRKTVYSFLDSTESRLRKAVRVGHELTKIKDRLLEIREINAKHPVRARKAREALVKNQERRVADKQRGTKRRKSIADDRLIQAFIGWVDAHVALYHNKMRWGDYIAATRWLECGPLYDGGLDLLGKMGELRGRDHGVSFRYEAEGKRVKRISCFRASEFWEAHEDYPMTVVKMATVMGAKRLAELLNN